MRRIALGLVPAVCGTLLAATPAFAQNPHFQFANNSISSTTGALTTSFKEVGLGNVTTRNISLQAQTTVVYQCFNNGGNHPKARNKTTIETPLIVAGQFPVRNGQTTGSLTVGPPGPGSFTCPSGQTRFLQSVRYEDTFVVDEGGATGHATPDPIQVTLHIPV